MLAVVLGGVGLQCYLKSDTEVLTSATDAPEEILVDFLGCFDDGTIVQCVADFADIIAREAIETFKTPETAAERSTSRSDAGTRPNSYCSE